MTPEAHGQLLVSPELSLPGDSSPNAQGVPAVVSVPPDFLVLWTELDAGQVSVLGARVDLNGGPVDAAPFAVASGLSTSGSALEAASDGVTTTVVTTCPNNPGNLCLVEITGKQVTYGPASFATQWANFGKFSVTSSTPGSLLLWSPAANTYVSEAQLFPDGGVSPAVSLPAGTRPSSYHPALSCGAAYCLGLWYDSSQGSALYSEQLGLAGEPSDGGALFASLNSVRANANTAVTVTPDGGMAAWEAFLANAVYIGPLASDGTFLGLGAPVSSSPNAQSLPAIAYDGAQVWAAWQESPNLGIDTYDSAGNPTATADTFAGLSPQLTFDRQGHGLLVYVGDGGSLSHIRARVLGPCAVSGGCVVVIDGGQLDGGLGDGGLAPDAGSSDSGTPADGGALADAGASGDGGSRGPRTLTVGCDCTQPGGSFGVLALVLMALWLSARAGAGASRGPRARCGPRSSRSTAS